MATSSIFQTFMIKDKKKIARFVQALEKSRGTKTEPVRYSRPVEVVNGKDEIRKMFKKP